MCYTVDSRNLLINLFSNHVTFNQINIPEILKLKHLVENELRGAIYVDACLDSLVEAVELESKLEWEDDYTIIIVHDSADDSADDSRFENELFFMNRLIPQSIEKKYREVIKMYEQA
jgi:hypothetical protein